MARIFTYLSRFIPFYVPTVVRHYSFIPSSLLPFFHKNFNVLHILFTFKVTELNHDDFYAGYFIMEHPHPQKPPKSKAGRKQMLQLDSTKNNCSKLFRINPNILCIIKKKLQACIINSMRIYLSSSIDHLFYHEEETCVFPSSALTCNRITHYGKVKNNKKPIYKGHQRQSFLELSDCESR